MLLSRVHQREITRKALSTIQNRSMSHKIRAITQDEFGGPETLKIGNAGK